MDIRNPDKSYTDCLYTSLLNEQDKITFLTTINEQIYVKSLPDELDDLETLIQKKMFLENEIQPQLFNFNIHSETYDNVYNNLTESIKKKTEVLPIKQPDIETHTVASERILTREEIRKARLNFYNKL